MEAVLDLQGLSEASRIWFLPCLSVISIRSLPPEEDL
jgi:hypothetical protein